MEDNSRFNQLEEQMSNTLKAVDKLTADMQELREYTRENNKVVNSILHKLEENDERFEKSDRRFEKQEIIISKMVEEMVADRKLRDAQFEFIMKRFDS